MEEPAVRYVALQICQACIDGIGQECHTPGCALYLHRVDLPIHEELLTDVSALESRVRELEAKCFNLEAEREPLIHDLERHIAIAAREVDARLKAEAELASREPSKSQVKRISAMVESAEIKRLEAENAKLRKAARNFMIAKWCTQDWHDAFNKLRAALKGEE